MATKRNELRALEKGEGCLGKAADDEPLFILRAKDKFAPDVVREWCTKVIAAHHRVWVDSLSAEDKQKFLAGKLREPSIPKVDEARKLAKAMEVWQQKNGSKIPD